MLSSPDSIMCASLEEGLKWPVDGQLFGSEFRLSGLLCTELGGTVSAIETAEL